MEAAIAAHLAPDMPEAMDRAVDWAELQRPMVEAVGAATWRKAAKMYSGMETWRGQGAEPPFSNAVYGYAARAMAAARAAGLVPQRCGA